VFVFIMLVKKRTTMVSGEEWIMPINYAVMI